MARKRCTGEKEIKKENVGKREWEKKKKVCRKEIKKENVREF